MTFFENTAQGGSQGTTPTTGNTGGSSGDAFSYVLVDSPMTCTFDNTHTAYSYKIVHSVSGGAVELQYDLAAASNTCNGRLQLYMTAYSDVGVDILPVLTVLRDGAANEVLFVLNSSGMLSVDEIGGSNICVFTTALPLDQWCRFEYTFNYSSNTYNVAIFSTATGTSPAQTRSGSYTWDTGGLEFVSAFCGTTYGYEDLTIWADNIYFGNGSSLPGPHIDSVSLTVPPASAEANSPTIPIPIPTNDMFAERFDVNILVGTTFTSPELTNAEFTIEAGESSVPNVVGYRSGWWEYLPLVSGSATFDTQSSVSYGDGVNTVIALYTGSTLGTLSHVASDDDSGTPTGTSLLTQAVTGGTAYQIRVTAYTDVAMGYVLHVTGPLTNYTVPAPPASSNADAPPVLNNFPVTLDVPVAGTTSEALPPTFSIYFHLDVPAASNTSSAPGIFFYSLQRITLSNAIFKSNYPIFLLSFNRYGVSDCDIRITIEDGVMTPLQVTATPLGLVGNIPTKIPVTEVLSDGSYTWSFEFEDAGVWTGPALSWPFTINTASLDPDTFQAGSLTVTSDAPDPIVLHAVPMGALVGQTVTIHGIALPVASAYLLLGSQMVTISAYRSVAATANALTSARQIDVLHGVTDAEHVEIDFVVPDITGPGGALLVVEA
jgi:hypothetical protein